MQKLVIIDKGIVDTLKSLSKGDTYFYDSTDKNTIAKLTCKGIVCNKSTQHFIELSKNLYGNIFVNINYSKMLDDEFFNLVNNDKINTLYIHRNSLRNHLVRKQEVYDYLLQNYPEFLI